MKFWRDAEASRTEEVEGAFESVKIGMNRRGCVRGRGAMLRKEGSRAAGLEKGVNMQRGS